MRCNHCAKKIYKLGKCQYCKRVNTVQRYSLLLFVSTAKPLNNGNWRRRTNCAHHLKALIWNRRGGGGQAKIKAKNEEKISPKRGHFRSKTLAISNNFRYFPNWYSDQYSVFPIVFSELIIKRNFLKIVLIFSYFFFKFTSYFAEILQKLS